MQLNLTSRRDPNNNFLQNPYLILTARLISPKDDDSSPEETSPSPNPKENALTGTVVSSLYSLKDTDNTQGGFFVFGDLSVRKEGHYRLEFTLYELKLADRECWMLSRVVSDKFQVFSQKEFPGMAESTFLTRSFSDQGVRLRLRKDSRSITTRKRNSSMAPHTLDNLRHGQGHSPEQSPTTHHQPQFRRTAPLDHSLPPAHLDRGRGPLTTHSGNYYAEPPQLRQDYGSGSYGYGGYEERSNKRQRVDPISHSYESDYAPYSQGPRTVPEMGGAMYPITTQMPTSQPLMTALPMPTGPAHYTSIPRLNTQMGSEPPHAPQQTELSPYSPHAHGYL